MLPGPGSSRGRRGCRIDDGRREKVATAVADIVSLLERVGYTRGVKPEKVRNTARQALFASRLSNRTAAALRGMLRRIDWALDNPGVDWRKTKGS